MNKQQLAKIHKCLDLMDEGEFDKAEEALRNNSSRFESDHIYCQFAATGIAITKALVSQTANDTERAFEQLHFCRRTAQSALTELTFARFPNLTAEDHSMIRLITIKPASEDSLYCSHLQLIEAECTLLHLVLRAFFMDDQGSSVLYWSSDQQRYLFESYFTLFHAKSGLQKGDHFDHEYVCGVAFTWGIFNLAVSLLPSQFGGFFGIERSNLGALLTLIDSSSDSKTIHGRFARLLMLCFHLNVSKDAQKASKLMPISKSGPEASPLQVYFSSRLLRLQGHTRKSLDLLTSSASINPGRSVIGLHLPCYFEAVKCLAEEQRWNEALQLTRQMRSFPSAITSLYLEAVMTQASTGKLGNGPLSPEVKRLFKEILRMTSMQDSGKLDALDQLALGRASDCLHKGCLFFAPQFELLLLWDRFCIKDPLSVAKEISAMMEKNARELTPEQKLLGWLLLALLTDDTEALIVNHILPRDCNEDFLLLRAKLELSKLKADGTMLAEVEKCVFERKSQLAHGTLLLQIAQLKLKFHHSQPRESNKLCIY